MSISRNSSSSGLMADHQSSPSVVPSSAGNSNGNNSESIALTPQQQQPVSILSTGTKSHHHLSAGISAISDAPVTDPGGSINKVSDAFIFIHTVSAIGFPLKEHIF